jgi:hypothetical protein
MATPRVTITDPKGRIIEMQASPDFQFDAALDSYFIIKENGCDNHTLTLVIKLHMNQVSPVSVNLPVVGRVTLPFADADGTLFAIKTWSAGDFSSFRTSFLRHCYHWNDKFWLTPPAGFTGLDYKLGGRTVRPNVYCHLFVSVVGSAVGSHRTIDVVNLDRRAAARQLGKRQSRLDASDFRSHEGLYDTLDTKPVPIPFDDDTGRTHRLNRSTIAHEIGHALGLPHIGVTKSTPHCGIAVLADSLLPSSITSSPSFPALYQGASNSHACYGQSGPASVGANVMGYGLGFDASNAQPWLDRIALHTKTNAADWKVSVKKQVRPTVI